MIYNFHGNYYTIYVHNEIFSITYFSSSTIRGLQIQSLGHISSFHVDREEFPKYWDKDVDLVSRMTNSVGGSSTMSFQ
jgi:hypothetical protein